MAPQRSAARQASMRGRVCVKGGRGAGAVMLTFRAFNLMNQFFCICTSLVFIGMCSAGPEEFVNLKGLLV